MNIYDTANQLERELRQLEQFQALKTKLEAIEADEATKEVFDAFRKKNIELQQKQFAGEEITQEDIQAVQEAGQKASEFELVQQLMQAEQQMNQIMQDINHIITKPLQELYQK